MTLVTGQEDDICSMEKIICQYAEKQFCRKKGRELRYRKIRKIRPGAYIFQRSFLRGLYWEGLIYGGNFAFQNRLGQFIVGRRFTVFSWFDFVFKDTVFKYYTSPRGFIFGGVIKENVFCARYGFKRLIFGGAYTWRGLFSEFYGIGRTKDKCMSMQLHGGQLFNGMVK